VLLVVMVLLLVLVQDFTDSSEDRVDGLQEVPWSQRLPKLVFRGTGWRTDSVVYNGNQGDRALRLRVARLALDYEDMMDVKLIKCSGDPCDPQLLGRCAGRLADAG
jgi:hypothetical protein